MFKAIGYNLRRLARFSGRDTRETFWPYALTLVGLTMIDGALVALPVLHDAMTRMEPTARRGPIAMARTRFPPRCGRGASCRRPRAADGQSGVSAATFAVSARSAFSSSSDIGASAPPAASPHLAWSACDAVSSRSLSAN